MREGKIDFLRGLAVTLVIFRHSDISTLLHKVGWIGVDLFFVLSGFLVSGLLFKEYQMRGNIRSVRFLIRRGFKIYPTFYSTIAIAILIVFWQTGMFPPYYKLISELFFLQSYVKGILGITWSLAVEEHFYFSLTLVVFLAVKFGVIEKRAFILGLSLTVSITCLLLRLRIWSSSPFYEQTHLFPTHLRIDSLLFGVVISYFYHFEKKLFDAVFSHCRIWWYLLTFGLLMLPFFFELESLLMYCFGLTLLYIGFGVLLCLFLTDDGMEGKLSKYLSPFVKKVMVTMGFYSYAIYLWHMMVNKFIMPVIAQFIFLNQPMTFMVYVLLSIFIGMAFSSLIEQPFLRLRNRYFPSRSKSPIDKS